MAPEDEAEKLRLAMRRFSKRTLAQVNPVWDHFRRWLPAEIVADETKDRETVCLLCLQGGNSVVKGCPEKCTVQYGKDRSTGNLKKHIQHSHPEVHHAALMRDAAAVQTSSSSVNSSTSTGSGKNSSMHSFVVCAPGFFDAHMKWVIATYQPLNTCEQPSFKAMIHSLNPKAPVVTRQAVTHGEFILLCFYIIDLFCPYILISAQYCML